MAFRAVPVNSPLSVEAYSALSTRSPSLGHNTFHNTQVGPSAVYFQRRGGNGKGFSLKELLDPAAVGFLEDPHNAEIRAFMDSSIHEIRLIIWGPDRPRGRWDHHVRSVPVASSSGHMTNKAALGKLVAVEYLKFCKDSRERRAAPDCWQEMCFEELALIALRRVTGNVYQAELGIYAGSTPRTRSF